MSGPERLIAGEATDFERELLGSWGRREPSSEARARVLALAGLGVGAAALASASASAAKAATSSIAPKAVVAGWVVAMKWIAVGLVGASAVAGAVAYVHRGDHATIAASVSPEVQAAPPSTTPALPAQATPEIPDPTRTIELGPDTTPIAKAKASPTRSSTLDDEVSMIGRARHAVTSSDPTTALQIVGAYDAKYPAGALSQESTEIRIEALVAEGNRAAAARLADKFIGAHPSSPYVHSIRALLDGSKTP